MESNKTILPFLFPWNDGKGGKHDLMGMFRSRTFTLTYVCVTLFIWNVIGPGHWSNCVTLGERLACGAGIWPNKMVEAPHEFVISFFTAPWFHNSGEHIFFVTLGTLIFTQSFEGHNGTKKTLALFFGGVAVVSVIYGANMHIGHHYYPENTLYSGGLNRMWTGGSVGFMTLIGALSHHTRRLWVVPAILLGFEYWNRYYNGISTYITLAHLTAALFGFVVWGWWLSKNDEQTVDAPQ